MKISRQTLPVVAMMVLIGCASDSRIEQESPATLTGFKAEVQIRELWSANVGSLADEFDARLAPALDDKKIFVANAKGHVLALAADSGRRLWKTDIKAAITGATGIGDGLVVVGTRKGDVVALDAVTGAPRWTSKASSEVRASPAVRDGVVVVQGVDGRVTGLSAKDGTRLWTFDRSEPALSVHGTSAPLIAAGFVLTGFGNGKIVALQLRDGKLLWEQVVAQPKGRNEIERLVDVDAPPLLWGEMLFAVAYQGKIIAVDTRSGRQVWTRDVSSYVGMDADRSAVFVADEKGNVLAFDQNSGASVWRQDKLHGRNLSAPILHEKNIVIGDFEGYLHWLGRDDGRFVARYRLDDAPIQTRGIVDGTTLFVASTDGRLAALQIAEPR